MKIVDRFFFICFVLSCVFLALTLISIPASIILFIMRFDLFSLKSNPILQITHIIIVTASVINWAYCLWFWKKYDKYSKSGFLFFFPHILYAPFYYYQVKIKKRLLKNERPTRPNLFGQKTEIEEVEMVESTRENILDILQSYQTEPIEDEEKRDLLDCWFDFVQADDAHFKAAFNEAEQTSLSNFTEALAVFRSAYLQEESTRQCQWEDVRELSAFTLDELASK